MLPLPTGRRLLALDAAVAAWSLAWIVVGVIVAVTVSQLSGITGAFGTVGGAIAGVGDTLGGLRVPFLGGPLAAAGDAVSGAGHEIAAQGVAVRGDVQRASVLLGLAVALGPILLVLAAYLPARLFRARESTALRDLVAAGRDNPALESLLAERALTTLSYDRLRRLAPRPWVEDHAVRRALAEEELRRLGVRSPWGGPDDRGDTAPRRNAVHRGAGERNPGEPGP